MEDNKISVRIKTVGDIKNIFKDLDDDVLVQFNTVDDFGDNDYKFEILKYPKSNLILLNIIAVFD